MIKHLFSCRETFQLLMRNEKRLVKHESYKGNFCILEIRFSIISHKLKN